MILSQSIISYPDCKIRAPPYLSYSCRWTKKPANLHSGQKNNDSFWHIAIPQCYLSLPSSSSLCLADTCHGPDSESLFRQTHRAALSQCHSTGLRESEREWREKSLLRLHALLLFDWSLLWNRSIFCFPRSVETEYIKLRSVFRHGWNANISCPWNEIISVPAEPKREYIFPFLQPVHRYLPGAMRAAQIHNSRSTCICRVTQVHIQTYWLYWLTQIDPDITAKAGSMKSNKFYTLYNT